MLALKRDLLRSLSARLVVATIVVVVLTAVVAGMPAYWLVSARLEQQAWARVSDGGRVTAALFEAEQGRLADLSALTAQRPTLQRLLAEGHLPALRGYLEAFQGRLDLDVLVVRAPDGTFLADGDPSRVWVEGPVIEGVSCRVLPVTGAVAAADQPALLASSPIRADPDDELLGTVTVGVLLDEAFARRLADETGLGQSIVSGGRRVATSLPPAPPPLDATALEQAAAAGEARRAAIGGRGQARYYTVLLPLCGPPGGGGVLAEVALPADGVVATKRHVLLGLAGSTLLVAAVIATLGALYARRLTAPLSQLTDAALNISRGDLTTPIPMIDDPAEVALLARALEESRVSTRRALNELSQAKAWSETLIQSIVEGIVTLDAEGRITFFSQGAERITGWSGAEVLGCPLNDIFRLPEDGGQFMDHVPPYGGKRQISVLTRTGRPITLAVTGARLIPPNSTAVQVALVLRDITEEEAIQHLRSYFLGNISHEFRTPLSALKASVEILLEEAGTLSTAEATELLNSVHRSVTGLQTLIDNLLESARIEAGRFTIRRRPTDFSEVVAEAVELIQPLLDRRQQRLLVREPEAFVPLDVDPTRMTQVLVNLLSNASKYSPVGEPVEITVTCQPDGLLRVAVADRGPGIPPAERANLFQRFVRLGAQDGTQYGVGLGLSVVKAIVEEHGGQVGVEERPGGGSVFWFTVPIRGSGSGGGP